MKTNLNDWLKSTVKFMQKDGIYYGQQVRERIECHDGTTLSVQASEYHYANPRQSYCVAFSSGIEYFDYDKVEVWCVSASVPETWSEYGNGEDPYAYIPITLVEAFIDLHGGIKC